jgi:uncharacterized protein YbbC (DUF1343 family)/CubicO group peptidase (beta-lactamase class C family)
VKGSGSAAFVNRRRMRGALSLVLTLVLTLASCLSPFATCLAASLPEVRPAKVSMAADRLALIDAAVGDAIEKKQTPGAVVLVARRGGVVWRKAYGSRALVPAREAMTPDTVFDLASLTKVVATATSVMILVERGKVRLGDPVSQYIPELKGEGRERVTIEHLLTHRSGYAPDFDLSERWSGYDEMLRHLYAEPLRSAPGSRFVYSDINYITLGEVVRRASGRRLDEFAYENIFRPLGMKDTGFRPLGPSDSRAPRHDESSYVSRIAPTENVRGMTSYLGGAGARGPEGERVLRGEVHDPTSNRMGGVAGHAGLFSTADDLAVFCQMILNGGEYGGARILSPLGVAEMTRPRQVTDDGGARGLGWDINTSFSSNRGDLFPVGSFGHTGFTGTSLWIDRASESFVVFLSNRVHPDGKGDVSPLRARVANIVAGALTDVGATARAEVEQTQYVQNMLAGLARFTASATEARADEAAGLLAPASAEVLNGIDVLERDGFKELQGLRVGLITNHTGRDLRGRQTIDVLREAPGVKLAALFSPEHGIRGQADEKTSDTTDEKTGLPVYSLYGDTRRPKAEQLKNLDALVFDIQDVGVRFYTYVTTMRYAMEEAAKAGLPFFVLDRPNPVNGVDVEGPVADEDKLSFVVYDAVPVRPAMTVGELARYFNEQHRTGCDLRVVKMENWRRGMWLDATGQSWVSPSPNMRSLTEATLYPGVGLLETTNLSVGRGTDTPFELLGAPWVDGRRLASHLNGRGLAGVSFVPVRFTPRASVYKEQECGGVNIVVTNRALFRPVRAGLEIAVALRRLYPQEWKVDDLIRLLANSDTLGRVKRGDEPASIAASWQSGLDDFRRARARALLYK